MLASVRRLLAFEMTIAEWMGAGVVVAVPAGLLLAVVTWLVNPLVCSR